jgi:hypothetical protein
MEQGQVLIEQMQQQEWVKWEWGDMHLCAFSFGAQLGSKFVPFH